MTAVQMPLEKKKWESGQPIVSIVTSVLNGGKTLETAINSVVNQSYKNIEFVVIDGGSVDETINILERRSLDIDRWISEQDKGIYDAWNKALRITKGDWVMFLGADDELLPDAVECLIRALENESIAPDFVSGRAKLKSTSGRVVGDPWVWTRFRRYCCIAHTGALHNTNYFNRYGAFDPEFRIAGDYELLLRAGKDLKALFVDKVLVEMGVGGISKNNSNVFREWTKAKRRNHARGLFRSLIDEAIAYGKWRIRRLASTLGTSSE